LSPGQRVSNKATLESEAKKELKNFDEGVDKPETVDVYYSSSLSRRATTSALQG